MTRFLRLLMTLTAICLLVAGTSAAPETFPVVGKAVIQPVSPSTQGLVAGELDEDTLIYFDDFEGESEWEGFDYTTTPARWHTDEFEAYDGLSWWCGEVREVNGEEVYGYDNAWLQYLETPAFDFTIADANSLTLEFMLRHGSEAGTPDPNVYPDYDGWDGGTVFVSTDEGETWAVLADPSYAYNAQSLFSFGFIQDMGPGISGWRDVSESDENGWVPCEYDLGEYAGMTDVRFRFAFASDNGVNTQGHPEWLGMLLDNIIIQDENDLYLDENGSNDPTSLNPLDQVGADVIWTLQTDEYHSADHAWQCSNGYDVLSVLISPEIQLLENMRHYITYWVFCDLPDSDGDNDGTLEDYYRLEISNDGGGHWEYFGHDYGYDGSDLGWVERDSILIQDVGGAQQQVMEIPAMYAGQSIRFRIKMITDDNDDGGVGTGLYIDDFSVIASSGWEHDIGVEQVFIPFPTTVDYLVPAWTQFRNDGQNAEMVNALWRLGNQPFALLNGVTIQPGDSLRVWLDNNPDDEYDGWMPATAQTVIINVESLLTDDYADNDRSPDYPVDVLPAGQYEYGYDDRLPALTTYGLETGEGPATRFEFENAEPGSFMLQTVRVLWNGDFEAGEQADVRLHILDDSEGDPGPEFWTGDFTVESDQTNPNWHEIDLADEDLTIMSPFWVWFELIETGDAPKPHIVFSDNNLGVGYHYIYDGENISASYGDWMIRVVGAYLYGVDDETATGLPEDFALRAPYPNPFNPATTLRYDVPRSAAVRITVFDLLGREVARLVDGETAPGSHAVIWNAGDMASGLYIARMEADGRSLTRKLLLLK